MSLLYKMKRLIKSDAHALVEGLEEPKWVLAQAIRDMEEELDKMERSLNKKKNQVAQYEHQITSSIKATKDIEDDINFSMSEKREDLAKSLIKKLILTQKNVQAWEVQKKQLDKEVEEIEVTLKDKREAYDSICTRSETLNIDSINDDIFDSASRLIPTQPALDQEVELEFLKRLKNKKGGRHDA